MGFEVFANQKKKTKFTPPNPGGYGFGVFTEAEPTAPPVDRAGWEMLKGDDYQSPAPSSDAMRAVKGDIGMPQVDLSTPDMQAAIGRGEVLGPLNDNRSFMERVWDGIKNFGGVMDEAANYVGQGFGKSGINDILDGVLHKSGGLNGTIQSVSDTDKKPDEARWFGPQTAKNLETTGEIIAGAFPYALGSPLYAVGKKATISGLQKFAPKVAEGLASRGALGIAGMSGAEALVGGAVSTGMEALKGGANPDKFNFGDAALNVGLNTVGGAVLGPVAEVGAAGISRLGRNILDHFGKSIEDVVPKFPTSGLDNIPEITPQQRTQVPSQMRAVDHQAKAYNDFEQGVQKVRDYIQHDDMLAAYPEGTTVQQAMADIKANTGVDLESLAARLGAPSEPLTQQLQQSAKVTRLGRAAGAFDAKPIDAERIIAGPPATANVANVPNAATRTVEGELDKLRTGSIQAPAQLPEGVQGYTSNAPAFRQATTQSDQTINRNQVIKNMRKNLGVVIDSGRLSSKGSLGEYKVSPEVIRSRQTEDIQVIAHEIGHHLDKKFQLSDQRFLPELTHMTNTSNAGHLANYQPAQHLEEGIAEYVRLYLTDPQQARQLAPNFTRFFEQQLDTKTLKGLQKSQADVNTWITQGEYQQAKGLIDFTSGGEKKRIDANKLYTQYVDDLNPLKMAEKALKGKVGLGSESIYKTARLSRGIAEKAKLAITRGIYDDAGQKIGKGLAEIVAPLEKMGVKEKDFATYLAVKHAQDLKGLGKQVPFTDGQMNAVLSKLDSPEMQAIQKEVVQFNNHLLDILVQAQVLAQDAVTAMRQTYPNYVPFMRYFDDDAIAGFQNGGFGAAKGFANLSNPVKRMSEEGSLRTIVNPLESMVKNTFLVMNAAAKNKVGLQLANLSKIDGAGAWVEHLGQGGRDPKEHIITVFENGKPNQYKVRDPELYNAMLSLDSESTNSLIRFLGGAASLLRAGATLTPEFIVRNPMRDIVGATVNSVKYGFNPLDFAKGLFHVIGRTEQFDQFLSSGGAYSTLMALDRDASREALRYVFKTTLKDKALNIVTSPKELAKFLSGYTPAKATIGGLRKASEVTELATKVGAFNKTYKKTGDLSEAAFVARDLMDFNRAGSSIRQANRAIAFMNAAIQGSDKMVRAFAEKPASFMVRAFTTLVLPSVGLYYWNNNLPPEQKKLYDNIPQWQKDAFFIIGMPGTETFLRIPKPFEAGMLFATGTDRVMRWWQDHDPQAFQDYGKTVLEAFTPPVMLTSLTPLLEAITNHSFFLNRDIVPMSEQRASKKDQYGITTSLTSRALANVLSNTPLKDSNFASPRIIDNTIKGYTAGLGQYAVSGLDAILQSTGTLTKAPQPSKKLSEQPFFRAFTVSTSGGGQVRDDFYKRWDQLSKEKDSAQRNEQPFSSAREYERLKQAKKGIDDIMKTYKAVQAHSTMSPTEKRARLDLLDAKMNQLSQWGLNRKK